MDLKSAWNSELFEIFEAKHAQNIEHEHFTVSKERVFESPRKKVDLVGAATGIFTNYFEYRLRSSLRLLGRH